METKNLAPINVSQKNQPHAFQALISEGSLFRTSFMRAMGEVLNLMLEKRITQVPSQKAVYCHIYKGDPFPQRFGEKVGKIFSEASTAIKYPQICQKRVEDLLKNMRAITTHELRNPEKGILGGAVKMIFQLEPIAAKKNFITFCGISHGLQEWENLALVLGALHYPGIIEFKNQQVQEIIIRAEKSVKNDTKSHPKGMSISEYIEMVFGYIDNELSMAA